jgi:hypothetical protein
LFFFASQIAFKHRYYCSRDSSVSTLTVNVQC